MPTRHLDALLLTIQSGAEGHCSKCRTATVAPAKPGDYPFYLGLLEIEWVILGFKVVKGPVDIGFWRLGPARRSGIMRDGEIGQGTASAVGWIFVRGLSGARDRSWRIW